MNTYVAGRSIRLQVTWTDDGESKDPTTVTLQVRKPDGTETDYDYALAEITRASTGVYYVDIVPTTDAADAGLWLYRFEATGVLQDAVEGRFVIQRSSFTVPA